MRKVIRVAGKGKRQKRNAARMNDIMNNQFTGLEGPIDSQHLLISMMLPSAVKDFIKEITAEVEMLCGQLHSRDSANTRWGRQDGSIILGNQHVAVEKPRVRSKNGGHEVTLKTYERFQDPSLFEQNVFAEGLKRVSQRDYEKGLQKIQSSFGFKKSTVSKRWVKATAKKLEELQGRSLREMDIRAVFIDGKRFRKYGVIVALGIAADGKKYILGIYQASSENHENCLDLLADLENRGLPSCGLMFIVDGGSGLNKALNIKYNCDDPKKRTAVRIRCHVHKWWNIEKALGDEAHKAQGLFWAIRDAKDMAEAKALSDRLESVLKQVNLSALHSYQEAKDDLLRIHQLGMNHNLKKFFSTTNPIESLNSLIEEDMRRVKNWKSSEHFQRWLATYCLANEKRMRKPRGHSSLPALWVNLRKFTETKTLDDNEAVA